LWGKFGQRTTLDSYEYINEWNRLLLNLTNDKIKTNSWHIINDSCVELRYTEDSDYHIEAEYISEITAVFTTANARIRLLTMMHWVHPSQIIYCDTDSVKILYDKTNPLHKYPSNDANDLPSTVKFGNGLGEWENECDEGEWIDEIVVAGAKSYCYKTNKGKIEIKQKGITLDLNNSNIFTFENIKNMVLNQLPKDEKGETVKHFSYDEANDKVLLTSEKRHQFTWNQKTKDIETRYLSRLVQSTLDGKRTVLNNYDTLPFGYEL